MNPAKIVVEYPGFATIAFRTFPTLSAAPIPPVATDALKLLANDQRP
jgi:hypothetical protein